MVVAVQKFRLTERTFSHRVAGSFFTFYFVFQEWLGREAQEVLSGSITWQTELELIKETPA
jgi:hypothetical protein